MEFLDAMGRHHDITVTWTDQPGPLPGVTNGDYTFEIDATTAVVYTQQVEEDFPDFPDENWEPCRRVLVLEVPVVFQTDDGALADRFVARFEWRGQLTTAHWKAELPFEEIQGSFEQGQTLGEPYGVVLDGALVDGQDTGDIGFLVASPGPSPLPGDDGPLIGHFFAGSW